MNRRSFSLRARLFALILTPLVIVAVLLGYWRYTVALETATELFDRSLLSAALAISRDVAVSGGDALSPSTRGLIQDASGGEVFYHATGPGGVYVTGYAYPPPDTARDRADRYAPHVFEASYRGDPVRVLRVTERVTLGNLTGDATVTVWQRISDRTAFARDLALRAAALMGGLLVTLALVVWFGVKWGLHPLLDLQQAIAMRSPDDLSTIKRPIPVEAQGIVQTLNRLFSQVQTSIGAHQVFISDAAHQLRNPAAAVQSMAEALRSATTPAEREGRLDELIAAARASARVADQLLSLDRLRQDHFPSSRQDFDLGQLVETVCAELGVAVLNRGLEFTLDGSETPLSVQGDPLFLAEAIKNLIDNSLIHGGADLSKITVTTARSDGLALVTVADDGVGLRPADSTRAFSRFSQLQPSSGSGLGLAIAASVAERHGGALVIDAVSVGASLTLSLPTEPAT